MLPASTCRSVRALDAPSIKRATSGAHDDRAPDAYATRVSPPSSHDGSVLARLSSQLIIGVLVGAGAGALAGAVDIGVAAALMAGTNALLAAFVLAPYGLGFGAVFGAITGFALAVIMSPFNARPRMLRRLRLVSGVCAATIVWGLCVLVFGVPSLVPGPNETIANLRSDLLWFYVGPSVLALVLGASLAPLLIRQSSS